MGRVTLTGTITCDQPVDYFVFTDPVQRFGRFVARGFGDAEGRCGPAPTAWTLRAESFGVAFGPGQASASFFFGVFDPSGFQDPSLLDQRLRLRRGR